MATETEKTIKARQIQKNDTSANWSKAVNFTPLKGELIVYTDLNKIKIGDGVTKVNDLPFSNDDKVSKAGDTMTGPLFIRMADKSGEGGYISFGPMGGGSGPISPIIIGHISDTDSSLTLNARSIAISPTGRLNIGGETDFNNHYVTGITDGISNSDAVNVRQLSEKVSKTGDTMTGDLKMADGSGAVKGSVSDTADGVALSAENGACLKVGAEAVTVCDNAGGTSQIKGVKTPTEANDAVNKGYVDGLTAQATETTLGTIKAPAATDAYTTSVGINESGLLYAQDLTDAEITEVLTSVGFITQEAG